MYLAIFTLTVFFSGNFKYLNIHIFKYIIYAHTRVQTNIYIYINARFSVYVKTNKEIFFYLLN